MKSAVTLFLSIALCITGLCQSKDSVYVIGLDTIRFKGTARTVFDWSIYSVSRKKDTITTPIGNPVSGSFVFDLIQANDIDIVAPGRGANYFYGDTKYATPLPDNSGKFQSLDDDTRFNWSSLQTGPTTFNWSQIDAAIKQAIDRGQKFSFGIVSCDTDFGQAFPSFVPAAASNIPDFNSEVYLSGVESFLQNLALHLKTAVTYKGVVLYDVVYKVDIRMAGQYGEWHYYPFNKYFATSASLKRIIDAHIKAFPDKQLMSIISAFRENSNVPIDAAAYLLMAKNAYGICGIRDDHLGISGNFLYDTKQQTRSYNGVNFNSEIMNRWKAAPIAGELMNSLSSITDGGSTPYWDLLNEVSALHVSQFSNANYCRNSASGASASQKAAADANILSASKSAGYRIGIASASISGNTIKINWTNSGNARLYEKYNVFIVANGNVSLSTFDINSLQPGTATSTDFLPAGISTISIIIKDPSGYRKPLPLVNKSVQADGSYKIM